MADNLTIAPVTESSVRVTNALLTPSELIDIELLIEPGFDWWFWLESAGWMLAGLLTLVVILYFARFLYRPYLFQWQLKVLVKNADKAESVILRTDLLALYHWFVQYEVWLKKSSKSSVQRSENALIEWPELAHFTERLNQACFSNQAVSRETYLGLLSQAKGLVKRSSVLPINLKALKSQGVRWKR